MSQSVTKLNQDTAALQTALTTILQASQKLDNQLLQLEHDLNIPSALDSDLKQITDSTATLEDVLTVAAIVPAISSEASAAKDALVAIDQPLKDAESALEDFDEKIQPLKDAVNKAEGAVSAFNSKLVEFQQKLVDGLTQVNNTQTCISALPDGTIKSGLQSDLDSVAGSTDTLVVQLTGLLNSAITSVNGAFQYVETTFEPLLNPFTQVNQVVQDLEKRLQGIIAPLSELKNYLSQKISISFSYPCGANPGRAWPLPVVLPSIKYCNYSLGFTIQQILNGPAWLENQIKAILSGAILTAANALGLGKLAQELQDKANAVINSVVGTLTRLLNSLNISIPGLDSIKQEIQAILDALAGLEEKVGIDFTPMENLFQQIESDVAAAEKIYDSCTNSGH